MQTFSVQYSNHLETQLDAFGGFAAKAIENTGRVVHLNLSTLRAAVEHAEQAWRDLAAAQDPRDFLTLMSQSQFTIDSLLAYGRALAGIAVPAPEAPAVTTPLLTVVEDAPAKAKRAAKNFPEPDAVKEEA
ncbi:MAG: phasin family protein [Pseudomonadota bacterium]